MDARGFYGVYTAVVTEGKWLIAGKQTCGYRPACAEMLTDDTHIERVTVAVHRSVGGASGWATVTAQPG